MYRSSCAAALLALLPVGAFAQEAAGTLTLTLGGHGVYWLKVRPLDAHGEPMTTTTALPVITAG